jgi:hypothetical protein
LSQIRSGKYELELKSYDPARVVPRFHAKNWLNMKKDEVIALVLPQFFPKHWLANPGIVFSEFPSRIRIGYVVRRRGSYSYLLDDDLNAHGLSVRELHQAAVANLARLPSGAISIGKVPGGAEAWIHATDDNFAAARILLPEVQREFVQQLGEPFLLALSHRDDCFCWSQQQLVERQRKHIEQALERFLAEEYNLTPDILRFSNGVFSVHLEQAAGPVSPPNVGPTMRAGNSEPQRGRYR